MLSLTPQLEKRFHGLVFSYPFQTQSGIKKWSEFPISHSKMLKPETSIDNNPSETLARDMDSGEGVPGDGRCLFRSVIHGAWLREGKQSPSDSRERELADELRIRVVDEFVRRRAETEWFVEGDFDTYVLQMRQPHIWGGEPELLMSSHVLKLPITVYMLDKTSGSLKTIAEYGQEYGTENPIRVLYHGYGHYDVLGNPVRATQSKLFSFGGIGKCKKR